MSIVEQIWVYIFATVVQLPFHLLIASPWLIVAIGLAFFSRNRCSNKARTALVSGFAAIGLAPVYGAHLSMMPIYTLIISGDVHIAQAIVSFLITWGLLFLAGRSMGSQHKN